MISHLEGCNGGGVDGPECDCTTRHLAQIDTMTRDLADTLREASDAGISHALIIPRMMVVFKEAFGAMPPGFSIPGVGR